VTEEPESGLRRNHVRRVAVSVTGTLVVQPRELYLLGMPTGGPYLVSTDAYGVVVFLMTVVSTR
jgi:hypothetical protein